MTGSFHPLLMLLALMIGVTVVYQALDVTPRIGASRIAWQRTAWYGVGTWMIGLGLWAQHFLGILVRVPQLNDGLEPLSCVISGVLALLLAFIALRTADAEIMSRRRLLLGAALLGAVSVMLHLVMLTSLHLSISSMAHPLRLVIWFVLAGIASAGALHVLHLFRARPKRSRRRRVIAAFATALALNAVLHAAMRWSQQDFRPGTPADASAVMWVGAIIWLVALLSILASLAMSEWVAQLYKRTHHLAGSLDHLNDRLRHLATHDALTGLPNRPMLVERLQLALAGARAGHGHVAVVYLDLDGFKNVNDSLGHSVGDMLLCAVAERLTSLLRYDSLARVGGDEFVAVLDRMRHADSAERIVERMLAAMQEPFVVQGVQLRATPSIGVAHFPQDGDDVESLIAHADVAMYAAKQSGRNGYSIYDTRMRERAERVMTIQRALLTAIEDGSLSLHFQPKHDSHTGAIVGAEALARWHHATLGNVPPIEFIGVAERSGQIGRIGEWVIRESCRQLSEWRARGLAPVRIAINLSPLQLNQPGLVETAARIAAEAHVDPAQIMFEVTETMAMENAERTTLMLKDFRARGFEFAIDDFGTGYSSLAYLQKFQVRQLKIDQFFIQALEDGGPEARAIIAAIIELAHTLNMEVVAEGVETQLQADLLRTLGCDQVQGYYLSMPMPPGEFEQRYLTRTAADCALAD